LIRKTKEKKKFKYRRWLEYLFINVFVFASIGLLSVFVLNFHIFDPFTMAFKDFTLTDFYYSNFKNQDKIYQGPIVLVNVERRNRKEIAFLLNVIREGNPKVIGLDIGFTERKDSLDVYLKQALEETPNVVLPYQASFDSLYEEKKTNEYFTKQALSFANLIAENAEYSTIRSYFPYYQGIPSFSSAMIEKYDSSLLKDLRKRSDKKTEIRYFGNLRNFKYYTFDETMDTSFNPSDLQGKIVLLGYLGESINVSAAIDEDKFYTPLNPRITGRSHPDMYGVIIQANILRMALDKDYVKEVPSWVTWTIAFLLCWAFIPLFSKWFIHVPMWAHFNSKMVQVALSISMVFITIWLYSRFNIKMDSGAILVSVILLGDLILFYDALVKFLKVKLKWNIHSIFFEGAHGH